MLDTPDYTFSRLTFMALRWANLKRLPIFKTPKGETKHSGADWSLNDWMTALAGEVGEAANLLKKVRRNDFTLDEARADLADELADVAIYLDILAAKAGVDLGAAIVRKFNSKSKEAGVSVFIDEIERTKFPPVAAT